MAPALSAMRRRSTAAGASRSRSSTTPSGRPRGLYSNVVWEWGDRKHRADAAALLAALPIHVGPRLPAAHLPVLADGARFYADYVTTDGKGVPHPQPPLLRNGAQERGRTAKAAYPPAPSPGGEVGKGNDGLTPRPPLLAVRLREVGRKATVASTTSSRRSHGTWGFHADWKLNRDSVGALSFVKYVLSAGVQASRAARGGLPTNAGSGPKSRPHGPVSRARDAGGAGVLRRARRPELLNYNITANLVMTLWAERPESELRPSSTRAGAAVAARNP